MSDGEADLGGAISRGDDESCIVEHLCHIVRLFLSHSVLAIFLPKHAGLRAPDHAPSADARSLLSSGDFDCHTCTLT